MILDRLYLRRAVIIFVAVFIMVAIVVTFANLFGGGEEEVIEEEPAVLSVQEYDNSNSEVRYTIEGPIVAREEHVSMLISIGAQGREIEIFEGYQGDVQTRRAYGNDIFAYRSFLNALEYEDFDVIRESDEDSVIPETEIGICPSGRRYVYEIRNRGDEVLRTWSVSCSSSLGSFGGDRNAVKNLFIDQIPSDDYREITRGLRL